MAQVFDEHDHIFSGETVAKNDALWNWMESIGFQQEYFEQTMSVTPGEGPGLSPEKRAAGRTRWSGNHCPVPL
jgi:hypothetical protein